MFKISLGNESAGYAGTNINVTEAMAGVMAASESLDTAWIQYGVLTAATENLESGMSLAKAMAPTDEKLALAVARNATTTSMHSIGQDELAAQMNAGTESLTAGIEGITDTLKTMWAKIKEIAKKIWDWITGLFKKVVDAVKGVAGSKGSSKAAELLKRAMTLKDEKKTTLSDLKDDKAEAIAEKVLMLNAIAKAKKSKVNADFTPLLAYNEAILGKAKTLLKTKLADVKIGLIKSFFVDFRTNTDNVEKGLMNLKDAAEALDADGTKLRKALEIKSDDEDKYKLMVHTFGNTDVKCSLLKFNDAPDISSLNTFKELKGKIGELVDIKVKPVTLTASSLGIESSKIANNVKAAMSPLDEVIGGLTDIVSDGSKLVKKIEYEESVADSNKKAYDEIMAIVIGRLEEEADDDTSDRKNIPAVLSEINKKVLSFNLDLTKTMVNGAKESLKLMTAGNAATILIEENLKLFKAS